jgi:hypothetical protein
VSYSSSRLLLCSIHCFTQRCLLFCLPCFLYRFLLQVLGIFIQGQTVYKLGYLDSLFLSLHFVIASLIYKDHSLHFLQNTRSSDCQTFCSNISKSNKSVNSPTNVPISLQCTLTPWHYETLKQPIPWNSDPMTLDTLTPQTTPKLWPKPLKLSKPLQPRWRKPLKISSLIHAFDFVHDFGDKR